MERASYYAPYTQMLDQIGTLTSLHQNIDLGSPKHLRYGFPSYVHEQSRMKENISPVHLRPIARKPFRKLKFSQQCNYDASTPHRPSPNQNMDPKDLCNKFGMLCPKSQNPPRPQFQRLKTLETTCLAEKPKLIKLEEADRRRMASEKKFNQLKIQKIRNLGSQKTSYKGSRNKMVSVVDTSEEESDRHTKKIQSRLKLHSKKRMGTDKMLLKQHEFIRDNHIMEIGRVVPELYEMLVYLGYSSKNIDSFVLSCCRQKKDILSVFMTDQPDKNYLGRAFPRTHIRQRSQIQGRIKRLLLLKEESERSGILYELNQFKNRLEKMVISKGENKFGEVYKNLNQQNLSLREKILDMCSSKSTPSLEGLEIYPKKYQFYTGQILHDLGKVEDRYGSCTLVSRLNRWLYASLNNSLNTIIR